MRFMFGKLRSGYLPLPQYEKHDASTYGSLASKHSKSARRIKWVVGSTALLVATALAAQFSMPLLESFGYVTGHGPSPDKILTVTQLQALQTGNHSASAGGDRRLRVFMATDSPNINLCKSVASAIALGYPAPILLNWGGEFNHPQWHLASSHIAKLESWLSAIEDLLALGSGEDSDVHEDDLAVLVDAKNVWFQLPPSALIQRYHQINQQAGERIHREWQHAQGLAVDFPIESPKQSIVVTTGRDCHLKSNSGSTSRYSHWPESTMPTELYRKGTDKVLSPPDPARQYKNMRPRCVNGGMIMGTMGSIRDALVHAKAKTKSAIHRGGHLWSDQDLFGEIIGDQEIWREWVRELSATWNGTASENVLLKLPRDVRKIAKASLSGQRFEYGIGLDYGFATIPPTCSAEEQADFIKLNDMPALKEASAKAGVPNGQVRTNGVPAELTQKNVGSTQLDNVQWGDVSLYTDLFSGVTPVGIHHNAHSYHLNKTRLHDWWTKMWFHPHLRNLIAQAMLPLSPRSVIRPLARVPITSQQGKDELRYWAPKSDIHNRMVKVFEPSSLTATSGGSYNPIAWEGLCHGGTKRPWHEEVFGDTKGPWQM